MRAATATFVGALALALAGAGAAAEPSFEGYQFPLSRFKPVQDPTARGDVYWTVHFATNAASACWKFSVFTRDRTRSVQLRRVVPGRRARVVRTFDLRPPVAGWEQMPWSGGTGFSGCTIVSTAVARAMVRAPRSFFLEAQTVTLPRAARAQLRGPAKRCPSAVNCS